MAKWMPDTRATWDVNSPPTGTGPVGTAEQRDAYTVIRQALEYYGLPASLADWAWGEITAGKGNAEVMQDLQQRQEFKDRFPAIEARIKLGLPPLSPGEYVAYEQSAIQMMRAAGLPEGFYDSPDDFTKFLAADVSVKELGDRVGLARDAMYQAPPEVRDALRQFGMSDGDLTAYFLDDVRALPLLEKTYAAAQIAGASTRTGFQTTQAQDFRLAELGVSADQAQTGLSQLGQQRGLMAAAVGRPEQAITVDEQIDAVFGGNAAKAQQIERRRRSRQAEFQGGGGFAATTRGVAGLGPANT